MNSNTKPSTSYYQNLDLLRFFLACSVVIYHVPAITLNVLHVKIFDKLPIFHRGAEAVYFFFTLSGFLITGLLIKEKATLNKIDLKAFYLRRVLRIWPVYFLVLTIGLLYYNLILPKLGISGKDHYSVITAILLCVFFLSNVFQRVFAPGSILAILWSIGVEEQFYLFWPWLFDKIKLNTLLIILCVLYAVIFTYNFIDPVGSVLLKYRFLFDFMVIGGIFSIIMKKYESIVDKVFSSVVFWLVSSILFVCVFFTSILVFLQAFNQQVYNLACGLIAVSFIISLVKMPSFSKLKKLSYMGKISYGIYMYHMLIVNFVLFVFLKLKLGAVINPGYLFVLLNLLVLSITFLVSHISYKYFETYFLVLKEKFTKVKLTVVKSQE
jgi:peptidoglycan/LPS O-acetylase OafA/YrhL